MSFLSRSTFTLLRNQSRNTFRLTGVYPTVVTPFMSSKHDFTVDFARFDQMIRHLNRYPVAGFALLGTSGEFTAVGLQKKIDLVYHARDQLGDQRVIIAGAGQESTVETLKLVKKMAQAGADACFVYNPTYFKDRMDDEAYLEHFRTIADNSPVPIILYNIPSHNDVDIPVDVVVQLAKHPNICGLLDTGGNITRISTICKKTAEKDNNNTKPFDVLAGSACFYLPALLCGCSGVMTSLANILPFELANMSELVKEGKLEKARKLHGVSSNLAMPSRISMACLA